ncbi:glycosyltransferase family 4 protein [Lyngbya confervoides]|uniref:Glycosyltransferase family 4 protein n=1 Tax=Lyngbya confervoides BDU141951 TaxID=1574623 RepID=A0ABD4T2V2_9CYAN|nr:glycosyltransferase family 4 protein [Lyngbya confervoides]MCM1982989.1 glycosyltransferase family 4 protein [Lyngbya confervoides BDU141951]
MPFLKMPFSRPSSKQLASFDRRLRQEWSSSHSVKFITHFFPPDFAATGQFISEIAQSLSQEGIQVSVFTSQPAYAYRSAAAPRHERYNNVFIWRSRLVRVWTHRVRGKTLQGLFFSLRCALFFLRPRNRQGMFVFTTAPPFLSMVALLAHKLFNIRYVCLIYDLYPDVANQLGVSHPDQPISKLWSWINDHAWRNAKALIVLNESMWDRVVHHCPLAAHKTHVVHNWADHERIKPLPKSLNWFAWKYQLIDKFTVLYSGNLGRCHDMETIFSTLCLLRDQPIQFVFIGSGDNRRILEGKVQAAQLTNALFLPYQDWQDLPHTLAACDVSLVSIAQGFEGLVVPSKLYSSMAVGRPVAAICEDQSYLVGLLRQAHCGQAFLNGDAQGLAHYLISLSQDPQRVEQEGINARNYLLDHFTKDQSTASYRSILVDLLTQPVRPVRPVESELYSLER